MKHLITTILTILLINVCIAKDKESKKESIPFSYEDYISYYGINDTSIAIIDVFFDNQNRFGVGQLSYLPITAAISIINPPIGIALMAITSPMVAHGLVSYGKYSDENLVNALEDYQHNKLISENLRKKLDNYFNIKGYETNKLNETEQIAVLKSIYQDND